MSNFLSVPLIIFGEFQASVYDAVLLSLLLDEGYPSSKCQHIYRCLREPWTNLHPDTLLQQRKSPGKENIWCCLALQSRKSARVLSEYWFFWQKSLAANDWGWSVRSVPMEHLLNTFGWKRDDSWEMSLPDSNSSNRAWPVEKARENGDGCYRSFPNMQFGLVEKAVNHTILKSLSH